MEEGGRKNFRQFFSGWRRSRVAASRHELLGQFIPARDRSWEEWRSPVLGIT